MQQAINLDKNQLLWQTSENALVEAADSISSLTNTETRIKLLSMGGTDVRQAVSLLDTEEPEIIAVSQALGDAMQGHAVVVAKESCVMVTLRQLINEKAQLRELTELEEESLSEIGNIILNSCLGNYADLLNARISSQLPVLSRGHFTHVLQRYVDDSQAQGLFYLLVSLNAGSASCQMCILWNRLSWDESLQVPLGRSELKTR